MHGTQIALQGVVFWRAEHVDGRVAPSSSAADGSPALAEVDNMAAMGSYDSSLQMFVQKPREIDMTRLEFLRWLAEANRLEHRIAGPSTGPLAADGQVRSSPDDQVAA